MKKLIILTVLTAATSLAAFGQGYMSFLSTIPMKLNGVSTAGLNVGLVWDATSGSTLSLAANPWTTLTALPSGWSWGMQAGSNVWTTTVGAPPPAVGNFNGGVVALDGTAAGNIISMYVVVWSGAQSYQTAAGALAPVGLTSQFNWTLGSSTSPGASISTAPGFTGANASPVPEPTTLALAGLGGLSLLLFRRKKA